MRMKYLPLVVAVGLKTIPEMTWGLMGSGCLPLQKTLFISGGSKQGPLNRIRRQVPFSFFHLSCFLFFNHNHSFLALLNLYITFHCTAQAYSVKSEMDIAIKGVFELEDTEQYQDKITQECFYNNTQRYCPKCILNNSISQRYIEISTSF